MPEDHSRPTPDNSGIIETHFDDTKRGSTAAENRDKDKARIVGAVKGLFARFTGTHQSEQKVASPEVMLVSAGIVPADTNPVVFKSEAPTVFEPVKANNTEKADMAAAIDAGPTSPTEDRERQIAQEQEAKARADLAAKEAAEAQRQRNQRVAGDPAAYDAYQEDQVRLQNSADWVGQEQANTHNVISGALDVTADEDIRRTEALRAGENARRQAEQDRLDRIAMGDRWGDRDQPDASAPDVDANPSVIRAEEQVDTELANKGAERILRRADEDRAQADREDFGTGWVDAHQENQSGQGLASSGGKTPSARAAEQEVQDFFTKQREARELKDYDIGETGKRWSGLDKPASSVSAVDGSRNPSVIRAEEQVDTELANQGAARILRHADEQRVSEKDQANRTVYGTGWANAHGDNNTTDRLEASDRNPSVIAAERQVTGPYGENERRSIVEEISDGADEIADRIGAPIEDGEIIVRRKRPVLHDEVEEPETTETRDRIRDRVRRAAPRWRRALALVGLAALVGLIPDRGPVNPITEPGVAPVNIAPSVPMPEIGPQPVFSPVDSLPKMKATFATQGPAGESISTQKADLGGWFDAEWVKQYKRSHPDQFSDDSFDIRSIYDLNLLKKAKEGLDYKEGWKDFSNYVSTHEIRGVNKNLNVEIIRKDDGSIDKILLDAPSKDAQGNVIGYDVPSVQALYDLKNK